MPDMLNIGIIGANGQVGSEVCLFLASMPGVHVIPICRTNLSGAFLRRCAIDCRFGSVASAAEAAELLKGCDVVADFCNPTGLLADRRKTIKALVTNAVLHAPRQSAYVYISSEMAAGREMLYPFLGRRLLARTSYGFSKRYGERLAFRLGRRAGRPVYALRLVQVHGELQAVTQEMLRRVPAEAGAAPDCLAATVFASTIAAALVAIGRGKEKPGLYTLASQPQWTCSDLLRWYAERMGIDPPDRTFPLAPPSIFARLKAWARARLWAFILRWRDVILSYAVVRFPALERRLMAAYYRYRCQGIVAHRRDLQDRAWYRTHRPFLGTVYGPTLRSLTQEGTAVQDFTAAVRSRLAGAAPPRESQRAPSPIDRRAVARKLGV